jgi:hypothetical protein
MNADQLFDKVNAEYFKKFGEYPDFQWVGCQFENNVEEYAAFIRKAIASGKPLKDFEDAQRIPAGSLT